VVTATIGEWSLAFPDDWVVKAQDEKVTYVEAPDGSLGLYLKAIVAGDSDGGAKGLATHVQGVYEQTYRSMEDSHWEVTGRQTTGNEPFLKSVVELRDRPARYRIRSIVACGDMEGIQVSLHNYYCENFEVPDGVFSEIEGSISRNADAA